MRRGLGFILLLILLISISFVFASFDVGDKSHEVTMTYGPGDNLQGWINISLDDEPVSSVFEDNEGNSISIIDLLRSDTSLVEGVDYTCSIPGCDLTFDAIGNGDISNIFSLDAGEEKVIGFKLEGEEINIEEVVFKIDSNVGGSCTNQLEIDFFADGEIDYINDKASVIGCGSPYKFSGCFNLSKPTNPFIMNGNGNMYCQRIQLTKSPGFKLGAWLKITPGAETTKMAIYDLNSFAEPLGSGECILNNTPTSGEERYCIVNYSVKEPDYYYVCIFNDVGIDKNTTIRGYIDTEGGCGFFTSPTYTYPGEKYAYNISIEAMKFDSIGTINITDYPFEDGLGDEFESYIYETYGDNCSTGCIIPIRFNSNLDQEITIRDISLIYNVIGGGTTSDNEVFDLNLASSTVSTSGHIQILLNNAGFTLPDELDSFDYEFEIEGYELFKETLLIERGPIIKYLTPPSAFNEIPINLRVNVEEINNASILSYVWEFGNITRTTTTNTISYAFPTEDVAFPVKITVTDSNGKIGSKIFQVRVDSYILYFETRVEIVRENIANIESQISNFSDLKIQEGIEKTIDTSIIKQQLFDLEKAYWNASTEQEYGAVLNEFLLLESNVPESVIEKISTSSLSYYPSLDSIELGIVKEVLGGNYDTTKTSAYKDAILAWNVGNMDNKVKYKQITGEYEGRSEPILNVFELDLIKTGTGSGTLFIRQLDNMVFDRAYGEQVKSGYVYIPLDGGKNIKFYTTQDIGITNLPAFISPALSELNLTEEYGEVEEAETRWILFFLIMFFLLIVAIIIYIILQQWYKHKYETYLFKDRNFLFNLINYIDAQKKKGVKESEIFRELKKAGWTSEQINYIIKKYLGKRTGMFEIPVEKILRIFRKKRVPQAGIPIAPRISPPNRFRPRP